MCVCKNCDEQIFGDAVRFFGELVHVHCAKELQEGMDEAWGDEDESEGDIECNGEDEQQMGERSPYPYYEDEDYTYDNDIDCDLWHET